MTTNSISSIRKNDNRISDTVQSLTLQPSENARLGTTTGIVSAPLQIQAIAQKQSSNIRKWTLKKYAEKLMHRSRTDFCMKHRGRNAETVDLYYDENTDNAHYQGLAHCDNVWACPVCSATISARRANEVQRGIDAWHGSTVMLTFTMRHHNGDDPDIMVVQLREAMRKLWGDRWGRNMKNKMGWSGSITNLDVTYHERNGWHIHIHQLVFLDPDKSEYDVMDDSAIKNQIEHRIARQWVNCLQAFDADADESHGLMVSAGEQFNREYVAKFGRLPEGTKWTLAREITQSASKHGKTELIEKGLHPFQILENSKGDKKSRWAYLWSRFIAFTKGRNQLTWSPKLKARLGIEDLDDSEIVDADNDEIQTKEIVFAIPAPIWDAVIHYDKRAELLNLTIRYGGNLDELKPHIRSWFLRHQKHLEDVNRERDKQYAEFVKGTIWDRNSTLHPDEIEKFRNGDNPE